MQPVIRRQRFPAPTRFRGSSQGCLGCRARHDSAKQAIDIDNLGKLKLSNPHLKTSHSGIKWGISTAGVPFVVI